MIVDVHAEATSEKVALARFLDGRASAIYGTHTHVQTADEQILPGGTAYITDVGMTGPTDGVIGMEQEAVLDRFLTGHIRTIQRAEERNQAILCGGRAHRPVERAGDRDQTRLSARQSRDRRFSQSHLVKATVR